MAKGKIKSWSEEQGFGYIEHPEYGDLLFDFEACDFFPEIGDEVEVVEVGKRYDGSLKAKKVVCPTKLRRCEKPPPPKMF
jgi:cold shock CspA family protein